jgi:UDP-N-acetylmuramoyl-L-alanyl-D-glutamate--2,6-diaminopimelate ligase
MNKILLTIKNILKKISPEFLLIFFHYCKAFLAATYYGHPAKKLFVIGITGTKGKTTAANFVWSVLNTAGYKTGQLGTAILRLGDEEKLNSLHMTMPSPFKIQKMLQQMLQSGCTHVVMEATSEGMKLYRHKGIEFDAAIFTNLTPEHLPSHSGSFEKYKKIKARLFQTLKNNNKILNGKKVQTISIVNSDSPHAEYYANYSADIKLSYGTTHGTDILAENIRDGSTGVDFEIKNQTYRLSILGKFNVYNALAAITLGKALKIPDETIAAGLQNLKTVAGRMEQIIEGQPFTVLVDYAHEAISMNAALDAAKNLAGHHRVIVLLGGQGGGRDKSKRATMGEAAAGKADYVICTNEDPYDDDPRAIIEDIARASEKFGKIRNENLFVIEDRRLGIRKSLELAQAGDIVLITGKGAEQTMIIGNQSVPWDDRKVVREEIHRSMKHVS